MSSFRITSFRLHEFPFSNGSGRRLAMFDIDLQVGIVIAGCSLIQRGEKEVLDVSMPSRSKGQGQKRIGPRIVSDALRKEILDAASRAYSAMGRSMNA